MRTIAVVITLVLQSRMGWPALVVDVTTDRTVYRLRQPVHVTLTETNTGDQPETVSTGCRILSASVTRDETLVWTFHDRSLCATGRDTLAPGASRAFMLVWSGRPDRAGTLAPGVHVFHAGVDGVSGSARIRLRRRHPSP
jgi:hypothetical protein